ILLMFLAPTLASFALKIGEAEYFAVMLLGVIAATTMSDGSILKGLAMVMLGIALGCIGTDPYSGAFRFTFGILDLFDGVSIVAVGMGLFGVSEMIIGARTASRDSEQLDNASIYRMTPTRDDVRHSW